MAREKRILFAIVAPFQAFFRLEAAGGLAVMSSATLALLWANSPWRARTIAAIERHIESVQSLVERAMHGLHGAVVYGVVPLFALANAGIALSPGSAQGSGVALGAAVGLAAGKPLGIAGATVLSVRLGLAPKPTSSTWPQIVAVSCIAGIGFTMSLLVGNLAFAGSRVLEDQAKVGVLAASCCSAVLGLGLLRLTSREQPSLREEEDVPVILDVPRFAQGYGVRPIRVDARLTGQTLAQLDVRRRFGVTVIGRWPAGSAQGVRKLEPLGAEEPMLPGDVLLVAGADEAVESFSQSVEVNSSPPPRDGAA